jgi:hypothetical protein
MNDPVDLGLFVAWRLRRPLRVNGVDIPIDDDIGRAVEARLGFGGAGGADMPALDVDPLGDYQKAQHFAFWMATAARALAEIGDRTGLLPSPAGAPAAAADSKNDGLAPTGERIEPERGRGFAPELTEDQTGLKILGSSS